MAELTRLKCQDCALQSECLRKERKEKYDEAGWKTYCPNGIKVWKGPKRRQQRERHRQN
jgi:hypothetical protein